MSCNDKLNNSCSNPIKVPRKGDYRGKCYDLGNTYKLKVEFKDSCNKRYDPEIVLHELNNESGNVNTEIVRVDTGFYYVEFTANNTGEWNSKWTTSTQGVETILEEVFLVQANDKINNVLSGIDFNSLILIKLSETIESIDGFTLGSEEYYSFSSEYNPFYCSVEMLRVEMGSWTNQIPDDSLALAIHWSSLEADNITGVRPTSERYLFARTRFVMYDAAIKLFSMPIGVSSPGSGKSKTLGDLMIENGSSLDFNLKDLTRELKAERDEWWRVVNAGGCIVPGQGLGPSFATKGGSNPDKIQRSREWHDPWNEHYIQPTQNSLYKKPGEKIYRHGFSGWNQYYSGSGSINVRRKR